MPSSANNLHNIFIYNNPYAWPIKRAVSRKKVELLNSTLILRHAPAFRPLCSIRRFMGSIPILGIVGFFYTASPLTDFTYGQESWPGGSQIKFVESIAQIWARTQKMQLCTTT